MEHRGDGLTLWYGNDETPAPSGQVSADEPVSVTMGVHPAGLSNAIDVEYRINGGPRRLLQSRAVRYSAAENAQFFQAIFPYLPAGSTVEYAPILRSLGRRIGPPLGQDGSSSFSVLPARAPDQQRLEVEPARGTDLPAARSERREPFPYTLERLARVHCRLAPPEVVGATPDGLRVIFRILEGRVVGDRLNAAVEGGGADALRIRNDGTGIVAVRTTLQTDDGARLFAEYSGVLELGENGFQNALAGHFPRKPKVYLAPRFACASPAYEWVNRLQCMGIGYVTIPALEVDYDLYTMRLAGEESPGR